MNKESSEILKRLESIFLDTFIEDNFDFSLETTQYDIGDWDSLNHIRLLTAIEQEFNLEFDIKELEKLTCVSALISVICAKTISI